MISWQAESHRRAAAATASGKFKDEIVPVPTKVRDMELCFPLLRIRSMLT
jgi:acetyl-CoA acetyltransferase